MATASAAMIVRMPWPLSARAIDVCGSEGGLLASELPAAPSRPLGQWLPRGVRRASLGHSGGPAPVSHRTSLSTDPLAVRRSLAEPPRGRPAAARRGSGGPIRTSGRSCRRRGSGCCVSPGLWRRRRSTTFHFSAGDRRVAVDLGDRAFAAAGQEAGHAGRRRGAGDRGVQHRRQGRRRRFRRQRDRADLQRRGAVVDDQRQRGRFRFRRWRIRSRPSTVGRLLGFGGAAVKPPLPRARTASWLAYSSAVLPEVRYLKPPPLLSCWEMRKSSGVLLSAVAGEFGFPADRSRRL